MEGEDSRFFTSMLYIITTALSSRILTQCVKNRIFPKVKSSQVYYHLSFVVVFFPFTLFHLFRLFLMFRFTFLSLFGFYFSPHFNPSSSPSTSYDSRWWWTLLLSWMVNDVAVYYSILFHPTLLLPSFPSCYGAPFQPLFFVPLAIHFNAYYLCWWWIWRCIDNHHCLLSSVYIPILILLVSILLSIRYRHTVLFSSVAPRSCLTSITIPPMPYYSTTTLPTLHPHVSCLCPILPPHIP